MKVIYEPSIWNQILDARQEAERLGKVIDRIILTYYEGLKLAIELNRNHPAYRIKSVEDLRGKFIFGIRIDVEKP